MSEQKLFPTETIDLPSKGKLYPENSPLRSGKIELKFMTAKEEDILTSTNLIQKGIVLDRLFESLIVSKGVKPDDVLTGDLNAVMVAARILGYGKDYNVKVTCNKCNTEQEIDFDLSDLGESEGATDIKRNDNGEFELQLPASKSIVTFKILTRGDEKKMQAEIEGMKKLNKDMGKDNTTFLRWIVTSVNGDTDKFKISTFVENLLVKDAKFLRQEYSRAMPNIDFEFDLICESCSTSSKTRLPIGVNFFWPDSAV
jgi:hypothetical protein